MSIFSLKEVKSEQVKNIANNNFASWPESGTYGYFGGGTISILPDIVSTIARLDFSSETISSPGKNLPSVRANHAAVSNSSYGYFGGGFSPPFINTITRLNFSNETVSNPGNNLPAIRGSLSAFSSNNYGYFGGGYTPPLVFLNTITRLDFSNETVSDPGKNLPSGRNQAAATLTSSYGYFGGGNNPSYVNTITRLDFSNETTSNPGKNLPLAIAQLAATSSVSFGYYIAGLHDPNVSGNYLSSVARLDFSNETVSNPGKNLPVARNVPRATSSSFYGYIVGGNDPPNGYLSTISRLDFTTENANDLSNKLPYGATGIAALSGGASVYRGSKTYGYFAGGRNSTNPAQNYSTIDRVDFSNETVSNPGKNFSSVRYSMDAMSNNFYGYFGGGYGSGAPAISTITRLDFSNETLSDPGKNLPTARTGPIATSSSSYGYFGGGYDPTSSFPKEINTITRLDFSNETVSDPGKNLLRKNRTMATSSNNFYGYFLGGLEIPGGLVTTLNTITRLDFSNETISNPGKNLPSERRESASLSSSSYGYFGGGYAPPATVLNTITRFDFSNETVSNPGKNLPAVRIRFAATSSNFYGYFGGGWDNFAFSNVTRLDFSNETVSAPGQNLTISRGTLSAVSNSN